MVWQVKIAISATLSMIFQGTDHGSDNADDIRWRSIV
jgi:hypothetical protein